jgi:hypothetical protein
MFLVSAAPDQLRGPPALISNEHRRVLRRGLSGRVMKLHTNLNVVMSLEFRNVVSPLPLMTLVVLTALTTVINTDVVFVAPQTVHWVIHNYGLYQSNYKRSHQLLLRQKSADSEASFKQCCTSHVAGVSSFSLRSFRLLCRVFGTTLTTNRTTGTRVTTDRTTGTRVTTHRTTGTRVTTDRATDTTLTTDRTTGTTLTTNRTTGSRVTTDRTTGTTLTTDRTTGTTVITSMTVGTTLTVDRTTGITRTADMTVSTTLNADRIVTTLTANRTTGVTLTT